jgi:hypothetical protein
LCISHGTAVETKEAVVYAMGNRCVYEEKLWLTRSGGLLLIWHVLYNAAVFSFGAANGCTYKPEPAAVAKTENSYSSQDKN